MDTTTKQTAKQCDFQTEKTAVGEQTLVPGVTPITQQMHLQVLAAAPLLPRKAQKP